MDPRHMILALALVLGGLINTAYYCLKSKSQRERWFVAKYSALGWLLVLTYFLICRVANWPIILAISIGYLAAFVPFCHWITRRWRLIRREEGDHAA